MAGAEMIAQEIERVALSIGIPPCADILLELTEETKKEKPDFVKIEKLVSRDVGLSATLLKTLNSPFYGLGYKISSISQAISLLGHSKLYNIIFGLVQRNVFAGKEQVKMNRFWDSSAKFALATKVIAKKIPGLKNEDAYTYGLFQNCGIPILMQRFPEYRQTLATANHSCVKKFTDIEDDVHQTDHATIGYLMTKSWHLPVTTTNAVRFHHEYSVLSESKSKLTTESRNLIAVGLLADRAVQLGSCLDMNFSLEWEKGGDLALAQLGLSDIEFRDICENVAEYME